MLNAPFCARVSGLQPCGLYTCVSDVSGCGLCREPALGTEDRLKRMQSFLGAPCRVGASLLLHAGAKALGQALILIAAARLSSQIILGAALCTKCE